MAGGEDGGGDAGAARDLCEHSGHPLLARLSTQGLAGLMRAGVCSGVLCAAEMYSVRPRYCGGCNNTEIALSVLSPSIFPRDTIVYPSGRLSLVWFAISCVFHAQRLMAAISLTPLPREGNRKKAGQN